VIDAEQGQGPRAQPQTSSETGEPPREADADQTVAPTGRPDEASEPGKPAQPEQRVGPVGEGPPPSAEPTDDADTTDGERDAAPVEEEEDLFWKERAPRDPAYGFWVVFFGLVAVVAVFLIADLRHTTANDVVTTIAPAFAAIAGLVGAYFGLRAGTLAVRQVTETAQQRPAAGQAPPPGSPSAMQAGTSGATEPTARELAAVWLEGRRPRRERIRRSKQTGRPGGPKKQTGEVRHVHQVISAEKDRPVKVDNGKFDALVERMVDPETTASLYAEVPPASSRAAARHVDTSGEHRGPPGSGNNVYERAVRGVGRFVNIWLGIIHTEDLDTFGVGIVLTLE